MIATIIFWVVVANLWIAFSIGAAYVLLTYEGDETIWHELPLGLWLMFWPAILLSYGLTELWIWVSEIIWDWAFARRLKRRIGYHYGDGGGDEES